MKYVPTFVCPYCGESKKAELTRHNEGIFAPCSCEDAQEAWERDHRAEMERRKRLRRKK